MEMHPYIIPVDSFLIFFFRLTGYAFIDFLIGTLVLAFLAVIVGEITISLLFLINRRHIATLSENVERYHNISIEALKAGDKSAYQAANKIANDAYGRSFFYQVTLSAGFIWPAFFALLWMSHRFSDVSFQVLFTNQTVNYACPFVALYIAAVLVFRKIKYKIPYFRWIKTLLDESKPPQETPKASE